MTEHRGRAAYYALDRSGYTREAIAALVRHARLTISDTIAGLGSGTGILTRHLLAPGRGESCARMDGRPPLPWRGALWIVAY